MLSLGAPVLITLSGKIGLSKPEVKKIGRLWSFLLNLLVLKLS